MHFEDVLKEGFYVTFCNFRERNVPLYEIEITVTIDMDKTVSIAQASVIS